MNEPCSTCDNAGASLSWKSRRDLPDHLRCGLLREKGRMKNSFPAAGGTQVPPQEVHRGATLPPLRGYEVQEGYRSPSENPVPPTRSYKAKGRGRLRIAAVFGGNKEALEKLSKGTRDAGRGGSPLLPPRR